MRYLCLVYIEESKLAALPAEGFATLVSDALAYADELKRGGHWVAHDALQPVANAVTVRRQEGKVAVHDGPFAETKEQLGGFILIEARDLNEAIQLASRIPTTRIGSIEVRPVADLGQPTAMHAAIRGG
jgi:hypothetical protein